MSFTTICNCGQPLNGSHDHMTCGPPIEVEEDQPHHPMTPEMRATEATMKEEMRVRIAEEVNPMGLKVCQGCWNFMDPETCGCGGRIDHAPDGHSAIPMGCRCGFVKQPQSSNVPDYPNDLNACAEFEKGLTDEEYHTGYKQILATLVGLSGNMRVHSATPAQRCEAFLRVRGKWVETKEGE